MAQPMNSLSTPLVIALVSTVLALLGVISINSFLLAHHWNVKKSERGKKFTAMNGDLRVYRRSPNERLRTLVTIFGSFFSLYLILINLIGSREISLAISLLGSSIPAWLIKERKSKFIKRQEAAWGEVLDSMISSLQSGESITESLISASKFSPPALQMTFQEIARGITHGVSIDILFIRAAERLNSPIADQIFTTILYAKEYGGRETVNLMRLLADFLREDQEVLGEIDTKFSWVRNSAILAGVAPWLLLLLLSTQPRTIQSFATPSGKVVLISGVVLTAIAYLWMERIGRLPQSPRPFNFDSKTLKVEVIER